MAKSIKAPSGLAGRVASGVAVAVATKAVLSLLKKLAARKGLK